MPELPEVETVCRGLNQLTLNQVIWGGDVLLDRTIAHPFSVGEFLARLKNVTITHWHRRGKYLLAQLAHSDTTNREGERSRESGVRSQESGVRGQGSGVRSVEDSLHVHPWENEPKSSGAGWLGVHLRMTGQLLWLDREQPLQKHTRVRLFFHNNRELRFVDQRTFGQMWWVPPSVPIENIITGLKQLGPEPFSAEFSLKYLVTKLYKRQRSIKAALLDQTVVAGVGNIYADEALFLSGIRPNTLCAALTTEQIERIRTNVIKVLQASIEEGGTTFSDFLNVQGINGNYGSVAWVYGRTDEPCRICQTPIARLKLAGRSSHFCPNCQL
ncbi:MAG: DNA-formamidopyrimidine glycosylase [Coleofasciculaceae cyanobacterium]